MDYHGDPVGRAMCVRCSIVMERREDIGLRVIRPWVVGERLKGYEKKH